MIISKCVKTKNIKGEISNFLGEFYRCFAKCSWTIWRIFNQRNFLPCFRHPAKQIRVPVFQPEHNIQSEDFKLFLPKNSKTCYFVQVTENLHWKSWIVTCAQTSIAKTRKVSNTSLMGSSHFWRKKSILLWKFGTFVFGVELH